MFGAETASRFLGKWETGFKDKIVQEARALRETPLLKKLLTSAMNDKPDTADEPGSIASVNSQNFNSLHLCSAFLIINNYKQYI